MNDLVPQSRWSLEMSFAMFAVRHDGDLFMVDCTPNPLWASPDDEEMITHLILQVQPRWIILEGSPVHTARQRFKHARYEHVFTVEPVALDAKPIGIPVDGTRYLMRALKEDLIMAPVTLAPSLRVDLVIRDIPGVGLQRLRIIGE